MQRVQIGDASWHQVGPNISAPIQSALVTLAGGQQTIWVVTIKGYSIKAYPGLFRERMP